MLPRSAATKAVKTNARAQKTTNVENIMVEPASKIPIRLRNMATTNTLPVFHSTTSTQQKQPVGKSGKDSELVPTVRTIKVDAWMKPKAEPKASAAACETNEGPSPPCQSTSTSPGRITASAESVSKKGISTSVIDRSSFKTWASDFSPGSIGKDAQKKRRSQRKSKAIDEFFEKVSIAGLFEIRKATYTAERCLFVLALATACAGIGFCSYKTALRHMKQERVFNDMIVANDRPPFPNVTICAPEAVKRSTLRQYFVVPEKVKKFIENQKLDLEIVLEQAIEFSLRNNGNQQLNGSVKHAAVKIADATLRSSTNGYLDAIRATYQSCAEVLSDCRFDGEPFDCSEAAQFIWVWTENVVCCHISLDRIPKFHRTNVSRRESIDIASVQSSGLVVTANINRSMTTFPKGLANDGFHIHIGPMVSPLSDPVGIPSGMDALIELAPPKKYIELTQCLPNEKVPSFRYLDYYDPYGVICMPERFLHWVNGTLGCVFPIFSYFAENTIPCPAELLYTLQSAMSGGDFKVANASYMQKMWNLLKSTFSGAQCKPLCRRWIYSVLSASYARVRYQNQSHRDPESSNETWSRIRIYFPDTSYWVHREESLDKLYLAACEIGGIFGAYAGLSMITFAEVVAYGVLILYALL